MFSAAILVGGAVLAGAVGEVVLRRGTPPPAFPASLNLHTYLNTVWHPRLSGVSSPIRHTTNQWGMRGSDPPVGDAWDTTTTIVAVGGSTTQCFMLDDTRTWPAVMQRSLRARGRDVWVGNAGQDGHSTRGHLRMMAEVISRVRPDYVLFLVGVNDLALSLNSPSKKELFDDNMTQLALGRARPDPVNWLIDHSRLAHRLYLLKRVHLDGVHVRSMSYGTTLPTEPYTGPGGPLPENLEDILTSLDLFRGNIVRLIEETRRIGATPVFFTQPLLFENTEHWDGVLARIFWIQDQRLNLSGAMFARLLNRFNTELLRICDEHGVACWDLAGRVPHDTTFYYDMVHFNDAGAAFVGEAAAEYLDHRMAASASLHARR